MTKSVACRIIRKLYINPNVCNIRMHIENITKITSSCLHIIFVHIIVCVYIKKILNVLYV